MIGYREMTRGDNIVPFCAWEMRENWIFGCKNWLQEKKKVKFTSESAQKMKFPPKCPEKGKTCLKKALKTAGKMKLASKCSAKAKFTKEFPENGKFK